MNGQAFLTNPLPSQSAPYFRAAKPAGFDARSTGAIYERGRREMKP